MAKNTKTDLLNPLDEDAVTARLPYKVPAPEDSPLIGRKGRSLKRITGRLKARRRPGGPRGGLRSMGARSAYVREVGRSGRRVIVKARYVEGGTKSLRLHLKYISRDAAAGKEGSQDLYDHEARDIDLKDFEKGFDDTTRQFRLIVSPENAHELDLADFTRELMEQMEKDLGTKLTWVAANHYNTDNPHVHIVIRGVDDKGGPLTIDPDYISKGIRYRAAEIVTQELGPRTELEIKQSISRDIRQERFTSLDRKLLEHTTDGTIDLRKLKVRGKSNPFDFNFNQATLVGRLRKLSDLGLARQTGKWTWNVHPELQKSLHELGRRGDIIKTLHRSLKADPDRYAIFDKKSAPRRPIVGQVVERGLHNELYDTEYLIVSGSDGRSYYVQLERYSEGENAPAKAGDIVQIKATKPGKVRPSDHNIERFSYGGLYDLDQHVSQVKETRDLSDADLHDFRERHLSRMKHLERKGIVRRIKADENAWTVPDRFVSTLERHFEKEARRFVPHTKVKRLSDRALQQQIEAMGPTWLDDVIARRNGIKGMADAGFGQSVRNAARNRIRFLLDQGVIKQDGEFVQISKNLAPRLEEIEIDRTVSGYSDKSGLTYRPLREHSRVTGHVQKKLRLHSGEFALVHTDGKQFTLVPWRKQMEAGQSIHLKVHRSVKAVSRIRRTRFEHQMGLSR